MARRSGGRSHGLHRDASGLHARPRKEHGMTAAAAEATAFDTIKLHATELLSHDRLTRDELLAVQRNRLRTLLEHAVAHSPYYREALGPEAPYADLADLPTLSKARLMEE